MNRPLYKIAVTLVVGCCLLVSPALAHYLWITVDAKTGQHGTTNIYFEGGPGPGDGQYLDPFIQRGTSWFRTVETNKPNKLPTSEVKKSDKRWLSAPLPAAAPRAIESYGQWGVYRYGQTDVLLHYYARYLDVDDHEDLHELATAAHLALDIVAHNEPDGSLSLTVLWQEKPAANRQLSVRGAGGFKQNLKTDAAGQVKIKPEAKGRYTFRTHVEEKKSGTFEGKDYQLVRHHATLILNLPLE